MRLQNTTSCTGKDYAIIEQISPPVCRVSSGSPLLCPCDHIQPSVQVQSWPGGLIKPPAMNVRRLQKWCRSVVPPTFLFSCALHLMNSGRTGFCFKQALLDVGCVPFSLVCKGSLYLSLIRFFCSLNLYYFGA